MYCLTLIMIGKPKASPHQEIVSDYLKRLGPYAKVEIVSIVEEPFRSQADVSRVLKIEADRIRDAWSSDAFRVVLAAEGKEFDSKQFAQKIALWGESGARPIEFILGGPLGLDPSLQKDANATVSLSQLTFPHDLARVMLFEQVYRAMTILKGKTYHY